MTDEQILQWTREAGFPPLSKDYLHLYRKEIQEWLQRMHAFARLAYEQGRKDENEACAKVCDTEWDGAPDTYDYSEGRNDCATAIRDRMKGERS